MTFTIAVENQMAYGISKAKDDLTEKVARETLYLDALKSIRRQYRKNGEDFKDLMRNFTTDSRFHNVDVTFELEKEYLYVSGSYKVSWNLNINAVRLNEDDLSQRPFYGSNTLPIPTFSEDGSIWIGNIFLAIKEEEDRLEESILENTVQLENLENAFYEFTEAMEKAKEIAEKYNMKYILDEYLRKIYYI